MPVLTLEAIRQNPWNVLIHDLPAEPSRLLLTAARLAATYCRDSEYRFAMAARDGDYVPAWWDDTDHTPDAHEESEDRCYAADDKLSTIVALLGEDIKEPAG